MAALGLLCCFVPLCRERFWENKRGLVFVCVYASVGYLLFAAALHDWEWPKRIDWDLPDEVLNFDM